MRTLLITIAVAALALQSTPARARDDAKAVAQGILKEGAAIFDKKDAAAIAATYVEEATLQVVSRKESDAGFKVETTTGRAEIERFYAKLYENEKDKKTTSRNVVESARFIAPDLLAIEGKFAPNVDSGESYAFIQLRAKQDGVWRIQTLQFFIVAAR